MLNRLGGDWGQASVSAEDKMGIIEDDQINSLEGWRLEPPLRLEWHIFELDVIARIPDLDIWFDGYNRRELRPHIEREMLRLLNELRAIEPDDMNSTGRRWREVLLERARPEKKAMPI